MYYKGGKKGRHYKLSEDARLKIIETNKNRSKEIRDKIGKTLTGRKLSEETKKMSGKNNGSWQRGKTFELYTVDWTETLRKAIRERDHYVCQVCLKNGWIIHHIDYDKKNCNPENLITLCNKCHAKTNYNREYWKEYFKLKVELEAIIKTYEL